MKNIKNKKFIVFFVICLLLAVALICGVIVYCTNGFQSSFSVFYIKYGDVVYDGNVDDLLFEYGSNYRFSVKNFKSILAPWKGEPYSVKVVPSVGVENDFKFMVDGIEHVFSEEADLTAGFVLVLSTADFSFNYSGSMENILQQVYAGKMLSNVPESADINLVQFFKLKIETAQGDVSMVELKPHTVVREIVLNNEFVF